MIYARDKAICDGRSGNSSKSLGADCPVAFVERFAEEHDAYAEMPVEIEAQTAWEEK
jgi:hypothetical protein